MPCVVANRRFAFVTASVGGMKLFTRIDLNYDLRLQGYVSFVGKSSLEVTINLVSTNQGGESYFVGNTHFIMVAR